jgi:4'-phosphopantetheinyl transferase
MPLLEKIVGIGSVEVGIWHILEGELYFMERLRLSSAQKLDLDTFRGLRRVQWLAARYLFGLLVGADVVIEKDVFGKPYVVNRPDLHVSFSHSDDIVCVAVSPRVIGVDVQRMLSKLIPIAWRIIRAEELAVVEKAHELAHLHVCWGAREALFKAHGIGRLDFRRDLLVAPFRYMTVGGVIEAKIRDGGSYLIAYRVLAGDFMVVYCVANLVE